MLISQLPDPYKSMALANQKLQGNEEDENKEVIADKNMGNFLFDDTVEGDDFWMNVAGGVYPTITPEIKSHYPSIFNQPQPVIEEQQGSSKETKLVTLTCMVCGEWFKGEEPKMCCSGKDCGCMGLPIDPIVCSQECYNNLPFMKGRQPVSPVAALPSDQDNQGENEPLDFQIAALLGLTMRHNVLQVIEHVKSLYLIIKTQEEERKSWADMCIKKQAKIEELENKINGL